MNYKIPDSFMDKSVEGAIERVLSTQQQTPATAQPKSKRKKTPASSQSNNNEYIILEGKKHGNYSYPDLLIPTELSYKNKNWNDTHELLQKNNEYMLTIRQFVDFLNLLKSGNAFYESGKQIPQARLDEVLNDIIEVRDPWRSEWLDAKFSKKAKLFKNDWAVIYHEITNGKSNEVTASLEDYLVEDKIPGIDFDDWLKNANNHGLPKQNIKDGKLYFYHPRDGAVARFGANSGRADLGCGRDPDSSDSSLGVRAAHEK